MVAGDDLRGERVDGKPQPLADVSLDARVDARVAAHRTRDRAAGDVYSDNSGRHACGIVLC